VKYCIGCKHLNFFRADPGYDTECTAGIGAHEASLACAKGHWHEEITENGDLPFIERAMQKAETCPDFSQRAGADQ
jgi:hypothetical protein